MSMSAKYAQVLDECRVTLVKDLEPDDVMDYLIADRVFTRDDQEKVEFKQTRKEKVRQLLELIPRRSDRAFDALVKSLQDLDSGHHHLYELLVRKLEEVERSGVPMQYEQQQQEQDAEGYPSREPITCTEPNPIGDSAVCSSSDAAAGRKSSSGVVKTRATRSKFDPNPPHRVKVKGPNEVDSSAPKVKAHLHQRSKVNAASRRSDRPRVGDDDSDNSTDAPEKAKKNEEKEMSAFPSLLESTLKLDVPNLSGTNCTSSNATMTTSDRLMNRIAVLRKDIMNGIGIEKLQKAYDCLNNDDEESVEAELLALLGQEDMEIYGGKIWQLKFCEETVFD